VGKHLLESAPPLSDFDCRSCGACCRGRSGTVLVAQVDLVRFRRAERRDLIETLVEGHFGLDGLATREDGTCIHRGTPENEFDCSIYELRPDVCRVFPVGGAECLAARRNGSR
jgi:Fe-S-cluster containining protein